MSEIIYSYYKEGKKEKRGTLDGTTFYRDKTPIVMTSHISLEPDVISQLEQKGCTDMKFGLRDGRDLEMTIGEFKARAFSLERGIPDKRVQLFYKIKNYDN